RRTHRAIMAAADHLSIDLGRFDLLISKLKDAPSVETRHELRLPLHLLHAIRIGVMMRAFEIAGSLPSISARHGFDIEAVKDLILELKLSDAADLICRLYPLGSEALNIFDELSEGRSASDGISETDYAKLQDELVAPLRHFSTLIEKVSLAIAHAHDAYG
ncbi:MAG: hypothetical protein AAFQ21_07925, partial [Pseudomonadota bacterium]